MNKEERAIVALAFRTLMRISDANLGRATTEAARALDNIARDFERMPQGTGQALAEEWLKADETRVR